MCGPKRPSSLLAGQGPVVTGLLVLLLIRSLMLMALTMAMGQMVRTARMAGGADAGRAGLGRVLAAGMAIRPRTRMVPTPAMPRRLPLLLRSSRPGRQDAVPGGPPAS